jgi:hypothetical protein
MKQKRVRGQGSPSFSRKEDKKIVFTTGLQRTQRKFFICREIPANEKFPAAFGRKLVFRERKGARQIHTHTDAESTGPISFGRRATPRRPKEITLCSQCLCGELLSNVVLRVLPHMVAIKDMKFADLFQCNGREDADGEVDDLFPESRRHALTPA